MGQRKYLIFLIIIFYSHNILSSAWLPTTDCYCYSVSTLISDRASKINVAHRIKLFREIEEKISVLLYLKNMSYGNARLSKLRVPDKIDAKINKLKKLLSQLSSYNNSKTFTTSLEYGLNPKSSLGISILRKYENFTDSKFLPLTQAYQSNSVNIFYKYILYKDHKKIFTISPQIYINKGSTEGERYYPEVSLSAGKSKRKKHYDLFAETMFKVGFTLDKKERYNNYYSLAINEGIKLKWGFTISNYTQYNFNNNFNIVYRKTLYEQLSISKLLFSNYEFKNPKNFTIQLGYFIDKSLSKPGYQTTGFIFTSYMDL